MQDENKYKGFWQDFSIADAFGKNAIKDTYKRAFAEWKDNVEYFASLVMTLNHKIWVWYERGNNEYTDIYNELWEKADQYGVNHFTGDDATYYFQFLD
jgi:hypothetical protein